MLLALFRKYLSDPHWPLGESFAEESPICSRGKLTFGEDQNQLQQAVGTCNHPLAQ